MTSTARARLLKLIALATLCQGCGSLIIPIVVAPVISPAGGTYSVAQSVTISDATPGAAIYFSTNGSAPTTSSTPYTGPIVVSSDQTIRAIAASSGVGVSPIVSATYVITVPATAVPAIAPSGGTYSTAQTVTISDTTAGASIYYTTDGTTPTTSSNPYSGPIKVSASETILAIATASGFTNSAVASAAFTITSTPGSWTWMAGSNTVDAVGIYGVQGTPSPFNTPGARSDAASWTSKDGKFWLFGGQAVGTLGATPYSFQMYNDLWQYNPASSQWTWLGGSTVLNSAGNYGTLGVPSAASFPGARVGASTWVDNSGNLWLFGGSGWDGAGNGGLLNDLWMFDAQRGQWAWMGGSAGRSASGNYGTRGVPAAPNIPGARAGGAAWVDSQGNLWLFGGQAAYIPYDEANDVWVYSTSSHQWTWISGSQTVDASGAYGTQGVFSSTNSPGARHGSATWIDANGHFWLFGGLGFPAFGPSALLNDVWEFDPASANWRWMGGSTAINGFGVYGTVGVSAAGNIPGAREWTASWTDPNGRFWLFGGLNLNTGGQVINDLWTFDPSTNKWTWMGGSNTAEAPGRYGTLGTPSATNMPGARHSPATWADKTGQIWLFGGEGRDANGAENDLNDVWVYGP